MRLKPIELVPFRAAAALQVAAPEVRRRQAPRRKIPTAQITINSMTVQPTNATMAVMSRTEPAGMEGVRPEDPVERRHEELAEVQDAGDEAVGLSGVEQEQDDARCDQRPG